MRRVLGLGLAAAVCAGLVVSLGSARAMMIAPAPVGQRTATADCVVVGKVTGFAEKTVSAPRFPGDKDRASYQVAIVKVEKNVLGARGKREIRVGFIPPAPPAGGPGIRPHIRRPMAPTLALNQEALLFLTRHHDADFYVMPAYFSVVNKQGNANFDKDVEEAQHSAKLLADPKAGLESRNKSDRVLTAGLLVSHYRQRRPGVGQPKTQPIDRELSKKILLTLAEADWNARPARPGPFQMTPQVIFSQLGVTQKDGWAPPRDFKEFPAKAKEWCKENADKYVIERFVSDKDEKKDDR